MLKEPKQVLVSGGKGGVGKTMVATNLAISLAKMGNRVLLVDADFGLCNVGIFLNTYSPHSLDSYCEGECTLADLMASGPEGISIISGFSGGWDNEALSVKKIAGLMEDIRRQGEWDFVVWDTAAGIPTKMLDLSVFYDDILLVVNQDPAAIADCYAIIKYLISRKYHKKISIIANMGSNEKEAFLTYNKLSRMVNAFLSARLNLCGYVLFDEKVQRSLQKRVALVMGYPHSKAAGCMMRIAEKIRA